MDIKTIQEGIKRLETIYTKPSASVSFRDTIFLTYSYKILTQLKEIFQDNQNEEALIKNLRSFFSNNWDLVKDSVLGYTAIPESEITQLLCDVAKFSADKHRKLAPIQILMPNIRCDSLFPAHYPNLDEADLTQVIKTHVLSQNCNFLIPVSLLADDNLATQVSFPNIYFDLANDDASANSLTDAELKLLTQHSDETRAIWDAKKQYESLSEDKSSLLGQLNQLIKGLMLNSVGLLGQETDAGRYVYIAILNFNEYWQNLSYRKKLPDELLLEINTLLNFATPQENIENNPIRNHINLVDTCIATRRKLLQRAIVGHEILLAGISITAEQKQNRMGEVKTVLEAAKNNLRDCLKNNVYSGQDQRGITLRILDALKIELRLNNYTDLADVFKSMNADEIKIICSLKGNSEKIVQAISTIEDLVMLTTVLDDEVLGSLLDGIKNNIRKLIQSYQDVLSLLIPLEIAQLIVVCNTLKKQLSLCITNPKEFLLDLLSLTPEQASVFYQTFKEHLLTLITSSSDFIDVFKILPPEQQADFYGLFEERLPVLIDSISDFVDVFIALPAEWQAKFYELCKDQCLIIFTSVSDVSRAINGLRLGEFTIACKMLKESSFPIMDSRYNFTPFLQLLSFEQCNIVCEMLKTQIPKIIQDITDIIFVLDDLPSETSFIFCKVIKEQLPMHIKSMNDFVGVLKVLPAEQRFEFYELFEESFPMLIKSTDDFVHFLQVFPAEQRIKFCEWFEGKLPSFIKDSDDFVRIIKLFPSNYHHIFFNALLIRFPLLFRSSVDFSRILPCFTFQQRFFFYTALIKQLPLFIFSVSDFTLILKALPFIQDDFYETFKKQLPELIKSEKDFNHLLKSLTPEECKLISGSLKKYLFSIKNNAEFCSLFEGLNFEQQNAACEPLKKRFSLIEAFINRYETQFNKSNQPTKKANELNTEGVKANVGQYLEQVLSQLKECVEKNAWNSQAIHLFRRPPDGIGKIRSLLANTQLDKFEKFNELYQILVNKCNNPSYFRKTMTQNFYQGLLANFQDISESSERTGAILNQRARPRY